MPTQTAPPLAAPAERQATHRGSSTSTPVNEMVTDQRSPRGNRSISPIGSCDCWR
ncbi:hypothetical protein [Lacipirellula sp.]|uniref:hypothetical protein n=1 Tax=Lacipirellula sp. TaxID=2691419 RepID=UPI003D0A62F5